MSPALISPASPPRSPPRRLSPVPHAHRLCEVQLADVLLQPQLAGRQLPHLSVPAILLPGDRSLPLTDSELPVGEIGEIAIFGLGEEQLFPGYEDEAGNIMPMANGIFGTGDLGRVDADGWLYIVGRSKEVTTAD